MHVMLDPQHIFGVVCLPRMNFGQDSFVVRVIVTHEFAVFDGEAISPKHEVSDGWLNWMI
jgi:hypothetical protein